MKVVPYHAGILDGYRGRQPCIDTPDPRLKRSDGSGVKVNDLSQRMNPRVGSPRAHRTDGLSGHFRQSPLKRVLNRAPGDLGLPAVEGRTVIGQREGQTLSEGG